MANIFDKLLKAGKSFFGIKDTPAPTQPSGSSPLSAPLAQYALTSSKLKSGSPSAKQIYSVAQRPVADKYQQLGSQGVTIKNQQERIKYAGGTSPERAKADVPWWMTALDFLDTYTGAKEVRNIASDMIDNAQSKGGYKYSFTDMLKRSTRSADETASGSDIVGKLGVKDPTLKTVLGFVADTVLDPTSYISFGTSSVAKKAGKEALEAAAKEGGEKLLKEGAEAAAKKLPKVLEKAADAKAIDRLLDVGAGKITKEIGETTGKELVKGLKIGIPFTKLEKVIIPMKSLPSEKLAGLIKRIPLVGTAAKKMGDVTAFHKSTSAIKDALSGKVNEAGKTLTGAERLIRGKGAELDRLLEGMFKGMDKKTSVKLINLRESGVAGDELFKKVAKELEGIAKGKGMAVEEVLRGKGSQEAIKGAFDKVVNGFKTTDSLKKSLGKGTKFTMKSSAPTSAKGVQEGLIKGASKLIDESGDTVKNITKKLARPTGQSSVSFIAKNDLGQLKGMTKQEADYWMKASDMFNRFQAVEPQSYDRLKDYVTHIFKSKDDQEIALRNIDKVVESMSKKQRMNMKATTGSRFMKQRTNPYDILTLLQAGKNPETNLAKILSVRGKSAIKSQEMQKFWQRLNDSGLIRAGKEASTNFTKFDIPQLKGMVVQKDFAPVLKSWLDPASQGLIKNGDNIIGKGTRLWKKAVTSYNPMYHARNITDNTLKTMLIGNTSPGEILRAATARAVPKSTVRLADGTKTTMDDVVRAFERLGGEGGGSFVGDFGKEMPAVVKGLKKVDPSRFGEKTEATYKLAIFLDRVKKGFSPEEAMNAANEVLFNYKETSPAVQSLRTIFPFITWQSKNIPLVMKNLINNPKYGNAMMNLTNEMYKNAGVDPNSMPDYALQGGQLPVGKNGDVVDTLPLNLSINDINPLNILNPTAAPKAIVQELAGMLNPAIKLPLETMVMNAPMITPDKKFKTTEEKIDYAGKSLLGPGRSLPANYAAATAQDTADTPMSAKDTFLRTIGAIKPIDLAKTQQGRNYDYIDTLNQTVQEMQSGGAVVPEYSQIESMRNTADTILAKLMNGGELPDTMNQKLVPFTADDLQFWGGSDTLLSTLVKASHSGAEGISQIATNMAQNPQTSDRAMEALAVLNKMFVKKPKTTKAAKPKTVKIPAYKPVTTLSPRSRTAIAGYKVLR